MIEEQLVGAKDKGLSESTRTDTERFESNWLVDTKIKILLLNEILENQHLCHNQIKKQWNRHIIPMD